MAFQGSVLRWVADHRRHHRFADKPWDTHSPYVKVTNAIQNPVFGVVHAHVGWMFDQTTTSYRTYAKDLLSDRTVMLFHYMYLPLTGLSLLLPYLYGFAFGGTEHAIGCLLFGGCVRTTLFHNVVWGVNSIGHMFGGHEASEKDSSRNNFPLAMLTFGEGWHNNHHASPRAAYNRWKWYQFDLNGGIIWMLGKLGLVSDIVSADELAAKRRRGDTISAQ